MKVVMSFEELVTTPFREGVNALCWTRTLNGDFNEVLERLGSSDDIMSITDDRLRSLRLSSAGRVAVDTLIADQERLRVLGVSPVLNVIERYPRDEEGGAVPTDVYSFHADSATVATDTYLCSYTGASSEGLSNEQVQRRIDIPATRAELLASYGGADDDAFRDYLREKCYDLHYVPLANAQPFSFGLGNLWRIAVEYPGSPVPPCIHRAPQTMPGQPSRLLLIS